MQNKTESQKIKLRKSNSEDRAVPVGQVRLQNVVNRFVMKNVHQASWKEHTQVKQPQLFDEKTDVRKALNYCKYEFPYYNFACILLRQTPL